MPIYRLAGTVLESYPVEVRGEASYRSNIEKICGIYDEDEGYFADDHLAALFLEDDNPADPGNAVMIKIDNLKVGYLSKGVAQKYRCKLAALNLPGPVIAICTASIKGGYRLRDGALADFGVRLNIDMDNLRITKADSVTVRQQPAKVQSSTPAIPVASPPPITAKKPAISPKTKKKFRWNCLSISVVIMLVLFCIASIQIMLEQFHILPTETPMPVDVIVLAQQTLGAASTPIPVITETPLPPPITPQTVLDAFLAAGLEAANPRPMTKDDYGLGPLGDQGIRFYIPSLGEDHGGRIIYFIDLEYAGKSYQYYYQLGKESAALFCWIFQRGHIVLQINGDLDEATARKYEAALNGIP